MPEVSGKIANVNGKNFQNSLETILISKGYKFIHHNDFFTACQNKQPIFTRELCVGKNLYNDPMHCDIVLYHPEKHPHSLIIECKWQQVSGSIDEKYSFLVESLKKNEEYKALILIDGGGYRASAKKWLDEQVGDNLIHVFNMYEFMMWANEGRI